MHTVRRCFQIFAANPDVRQHLPYYNLHRLRAQYECQHDKWGTHIYPKTEIMAHTYAGKSIKWKQYTFAAELHELRLRYGEYGDGYQRGRTNNAVAPLPVASHCVRVAVMAGVTMIWRT
ncbi:hypothetical protein J1614_004113 [Plenodomus biglobosus]|nr:hypothetical protein J1614_004113 [Plenodomus biglobosus]